jgi:tetratricopeptide (TPR) repeat protein
MKIRKITLLLFLISFIMFSHVNGQNNTNLEKIVDFSDNGGFPSLCSNDDSIIVNCFTSNSVYWIKDGKKVKIMDYPAGGINNAVNASPDGSNYSYILGDDIYINDKSNKTIVRIQIPHENYLDSVAWSYDSKNLYYCEQIGTDSQIYSYIYSYNISTGAKQEVFKKKGKFQNLTTVKNSKVIYLLLDCSEDSTPPTCDIYRYDLITKELKKLPDIDNITFDFTISPDERVIMYENISTEYIYVIDASRMKIIDKIKVPKGVYDIPPYSWKSDSSYVIFTMTKKEIYKYTIPSLSTIAIEQEQLLTLDYALRFHQLPGGKELSSKEKQEQINKANSLSEEGFAFYKDRYDSAAVDKYEEALTHYATAEIYYRYGNSLSNIPRLEDAIKAYQIAIGLNYDKPYLIYYNIACAYSRLKDSKDAFANLELAINKGYNNFGQIQKDTDLAYLRSLPEWKDWWGKHQK